MDDLDIGELNHTRDAGQVDVGGGHKLHFERWGAARGAPVIVLHGGPGAAFNETHKRLFNPTKHDALFFDQRGAGRSVPAGRIESNRTADLISDIDRLRDHLGIRGSMNVAGGSWGATLAMLYAQHRPENVRSLMMWSTFLATRKEIHDPLGLQTRDRHFPHPRAWQQLVRLIPRELRNDPQRIIEYALSVFNSMDAVKAWELAVAYTVYDMATCNSPTYDEARVRREAEDDPNVVHAARIQMYYFANGCFMSANQIIDNIGKIKAIRANVVHGIDDWCTRPKASEDLKRAYGPNMTVQFVRSGHLRSDPEMTKALQSISERLT